MSSFIRVYVHYVFSTKNHEPFIVSELEKKLWAYMGGIARANNMKAIAINGTEDHAHVLLSLPSTITIAKAIQVVKGGSSHWVHQTFPEYRDFEWQKGYGAFSVSHFDLDRIIAYIKNQKKHHAVEDSKTEYIDLLNKHQIEYDEKYIWE